MAAQHPGPFEVDDAVVLLLGAPTAVGTLRDHIEGITRLEKLIFLLQQESEVADSLTEDPAFISHNFGPFSAKIYQAVDTLVAAGLLVDSTKPSASPEDSWETEEVVGTPTVDPYATRDFELTERGRRYYQALIRELPESTEKALSAFKDRFGALPLRQLIRYVYKRYPDFTEKSVIRNKVL